MSSKSSPDEMFWEVAEKRMTLVGGRFDWDQLPTGQTPQSTVR